MTYTSTSGFIYDVGMHINSPEMFDEAPTGTLVDWPHNGYELRWEKRGELWHNIGGLGWLARTGVDMWAGGAQLPNYRITFMPEEAEATAALTLRDLLDLPVGSVVETRNATEPNPHRAYTKRDNGNWQAWIEHHRHNIPSGDLIGMLAANNRRRTYTLAFRPDQAELNRVARSAPQVGDRVTDETLPTSPQAPDHLQRELDQMQMRIRECINSAVVDQGGSTGDVRDGAWMRLGWDPIPERGFVISSKAAYGLPNNSLVMQNGNLFRINHDRNWPERYSVDGTGHGYDYQHDGQATVIWTEPAPAPVYYSALDMLNKFWVVYLAMQQRESWCGYVNDCLHARELTDPGPQPQEFIALDEVVELTQVTLEVGSEVDTRNLNDITMRDQIKAAFMDLPIGSLAVGLSSNILYFKTADRWVCGHDMTSAFSSRTGRLAVRITHIPTPEHSVAQVEYDLPF